MEFTDEREDFPFLLCTNFHSARRPLGRLPVAPSVTRLLLALPPRSRMRSVLRPLTIGHGTRRANNTVALSLSLSLSPLSLCYSLTLLLSLSFSLSLSLLLSYSLTLSLSYSLSHSLTHSLARSLTRSFIDDGVCPQRIKTVTKRWHRSCLTSRAHEQCSDSASDRDRSRQRARDLRRARRRRWAR